MITIHIGLPKTGTTSLQNSIFKKIEDIEILPKSGTTLNLIRDTKKEILFSSYETYLYNVIKKNLVKQALTSINNIKNIFVNPKIIFGYRNHSDYIKALYLQSLNQNKYWSFNDFFSLENNNSFFNKNDFLLEPIVHELKQNFSEIYFYDLEDLKNNNEKIINEILLFIGSKMEFKDFEVKNDNISIKTKLQFEILIKLNKLSSFIPNFLPSLHSKPFKILGITPRQIAQKHLKNVPSKPIILNGFDKERIDDYYKLDWQKVKELIGEK